MLKNSKQSIHCQTNLNRMLPFLVVNCKTVAGMKYIESSKYFGKNHDNVKNTNGRWGEHNDIYGLKLGEKGVDAY